MEAVLDGLLAMPATLPSFLVEAFLASVMAERELAGLKPELPEHDAVSMPTPVFQTLLESSCLAAGNPRFGLLVGKRLTEANLHLLGPVIVASPSLRAVAEHMDNLQTAVFGARFWAFAERDNDHTLYAPLHEFSSRALSEMVLALAFSCATRFVGEPRSRELAALFTFDSPADAVPYQRVFGGRVFFGAARSGIRFPNSLLDVERPGTDPGLATMLCEIVKERFAANESQSWASRVERTLRGHKQLAHVDIESVAACWQLTGRSLRRRMEREGVRFNDVLKRVRFERACQMLTRGSTPIARIAVTLGYGDSSAFQRAFKRSAGVGPAEFRSRERTRRVVARR